MVQFAAQREVPAHWPLAETRLQLDLGGEGLVSVDYPDGTTVRFGNDPYHHEFPVRGQTLRDLGRDRRAPAVRRAGAESGARRDAMLAWLDLPVHQFHLRLRQIWEAGVQLEDHEVVAHLVAAAEAAFHALDWPSSTADYIARFAPQQGQQKIWQLPPLKDNPARSHRRRSAAA